uniref:Ig-like domain-containing protein n=1 Tax=Strigamia maritima TaxID=126957 RepID=T1JL51_STRMM
FFYDSHELRLTLIKNWIVKQYYEVQVYDEYVIRGNTAVLKCQVPSFVRDYVRVTSWLVDDVLISSTNANS